MRRMTFFLPSMNKLIVEKKQPGLQFVAAVVRDAAATDTRR